MVDDIRDAGPVAGPPLFPAHRICNRQRGQVAHTDHAASLDFGEGVA